MCRLVPAVIAAALASQLYAAPGGSTSGSTSLSLQPPARTTFDPQEIRLEVGKTVKARAFVSTNVANLSGEKLVRVTDLGTPDGGRPDVKVTFRNPVSVSTEQGSWSVEIEVDDMPPVAALTRVAHLEFTNGKKDSATYVLTSKVKEFSWTVSTGAKIVNFEPNDRFTITILATGDRASNLRLASSSLQSSDGGGIQEHFLTLLPASLAKAAEEDAKKGAKKHVKNDAENKATQQILKIEEGVPTQFDVQFDTARIPSGTYNGTVNFAIDESPDVKGVELTFHTSSRCVRAAGFILILAGVGLSLLIAAILRPAVANAEALIPAVRLAEIVATRKAQIEACGVAAMTPETIHTLNAIASSLSREQLTLAGLLHGWIANPFQTSSMDVLTAYLRERNNALAALGHLIDHGICAAASRLIDPRNKDHVKARDVALDTLDKLGARGGQSLEQIAARIPPILAEFDAVLSSGKEELQEAGGRRASALPTMHQLLFRITVISAFAWLIVMIVTVVTGYAVLIATNRGFGSSLDLIKCFLWGIGVQTAAQQFAQTTSSSIVSSFGFRSAATPELPQ